MLVMQEEERAVSELKNLISCRINARQIVEMHSRGVTASRLSKALDGMEAIDSSDNYTILFLADNPAFQSMSLIEATALLKSLRRHPSVRLRFDQLADAKCVEACISDRLDPVRKQLLFSTLVCNQENDMP